MSGDRLARKLPRPLCIGFGEHEGRCENKAGSTHSDLWCQRCDDERRAHITRQMEGILARLAPPAEDQGDSGAAE